MPIEPPTGARGVCCLDMVAPSVAGMPGTNGYKRLRACLPARAAPGEWFPIGPYDLLLRKNGSIDLRRKVRMRHGWRYRVDRVSRRGITYFQDFRPLED